MALLFLKKWTKASFIFASALHGRRSVRYRVHAASNYNSNCNLRNSQNFEIPFARLCSFQSSFFSVNSQDYGTTLRNQYVALLLIV